MAEHLCKDQRQAEKDARKAAERLAEGKDCFTCAKCGRASHKAAHVCKPEPRRAAGG